MTLREQIVIGSTVAISLSLAAGDFLVIKAEELRELSGKSIVNEQVANGLAKRSVEDLLNIRQILGHDPNVVQSINAALMLKSNAAFRN